MSAFVRSLPVRSSTGRIRTIPICFNAMTREYFGFINAVISEDLRVMVGWHTIQELTTLRNGFA